MRDFRTALLATAMVFGLASAASAGPGAVDWTGVFISGQIGGGGDVNKVLQNFNPYTFGGTTVGAVNPLTDAVPGVGGTSNTPVPTPNGYQSLTSQTFSTGAAIGQALTNTANPVNQQSITYVNAPTTLGDRRVFGSGGLEFGYLKQFNNIVVGAAADFNWLARSNGDGSWMSNGGYADTVISSGAGGSTCPNNNYSVCTVSGTSAASGSVQATANWLGTLRAKIGFAGDRWLAYVTGGLAYGQVRLASSATYADGNFYNYTACGGGCGAPATYIVAPSTAASWSGSMTQTRTGWALGGGLNYALTNNFFVKTEGIYYDLGRSSLTVSGTGTTSCITVGSVAGCGGASYAGVATPVAGYTVQRRFNGVIASLGAGIKF